MIRPALRPSRLAPSSRRWRGVASGALIMALATAFGAAALAQTPPAATAPAPAPAAPAETPPAAAPAPATPATPPSTPPQSASPSTAAPVPPPAVQAADPFGEELTLAARTVVMAKGNASWDSAFETITNSLKTLKEALDKQGVKPAAAPLIVYTSTDDTGFVFQAEIPVDEAPKSSLGKDITIGKSPEGKALKFVHRGSYDNMDNTYEAITNHLDEKKLEAKDSFIEEYVTDPLTTAEDKLIINVFVPLR